MNIIEVKNLTKKFGNITAVDNISLEIEEGSIFGLLGPNGAGKTTTIECMIGIKKPTTGDIKILGMDVLKVGKQIYDHIGVQLQETAYQDKIKVYELCELFTAMYKKPVDYKPLLMRFGLDDKYKAYIHNLSGGQKQKVAIILALIANPKVIFLDELTTGLDPKARREMWNLVNDLKEEGKTIFITTHYMEEAAYLCDKIGIIDSGKLLVIDDVEGVIEHAQLEHEVNFIAKEEVVNKLRFMLEEVISNRESNKNNSVQDANIINREIDIQYDNGRVKVFSKYEDIISDVILALHHMKSSYKQVNILRPSLEDAYLKLTGKEWEA